MKNFKRQIVMPLVMALSFPVMVSVAGNECNANQGNPPASQERAKGKSLSVITKGIKIKFDAEAPTWKTVACTVDGKEINIRNACSPKAARPIVDENKIDNFQEPVKYFAFWSTAAPKKDQYALMFGGYEYAPVISEKNGWLELLGIGVKGENGWVSAQYCQKYDLQKITRDDLKENYDMYLNLSGDYVIGKYFSEMDEYVQIDFGKLVNGVVVFPYSLYLGFEHGSQWKITGTEDNYVLQVPKKDCDEYGCPDMSKMPPSVLSDAVQKKKYHAPAYLCKVNGSLIMMP